MVTRKVFIDESHENFTNVSFHISTIKGIEPNNLSVSSLTLGWTWNICDILIKSTIFKSNVVIRGCFVKVIFIRRVLRNSIANHWWNLIDLLMEGYIYLCIFKIYIIYMIYETYDKYLYMIWDWRYRYTRYTIYIYGIYMVIKTEQFCISFEISSIILNLFLLTYEHIYNVTNNRYMQPAIRSVIRVNYRVVWLFTIIRNT